jgi:hypothetical protein
MISRSSAYSRKHATFGCGLGRLHVCRCRRNRAFLTQRRQDSGARPRSSQIAVDPQRAGDHIVLVIVDALALRLAVRTGFPGLVTRAGYLRTQPVTYV